MWARKCGVLGLMFRQCLFRMNVSKKPSNPQFTFIIIIDEKKSVSPFSQIKYMVPMCVRLRCVHRALHTVFAFLMSLTFCLSTQQHFLRSENLIVLNLNSNMRQPARRFAAGNRKFIPHFRKPTEKNGSINFKIACRVDSIGKSM